MRRRGVVDANEKGRRLNAYRGHRGRTHSVQAAFLIATRYDANGRCETPHRLAKSFVQAHFIERCLLLYNVHVEPLKREAAGD